LQIFDLEIIAGAEEHNWEGLANSYPRFKTVISIDSSFLNKKLNGYCEIRF